MPGRGAGPGALRRTTAAEKLLTSAVNVAVAVLVWLPLACLLPGLLAGKLALVGVFLLENLACIALCQYRLPGMLVQGAFWCRPWPRRNQCLHAILYTASFASLLFWVWVPLDLFLFNMLLLQLPALRLTGTTLHGWLAGGMVDCKRKRAKCARLAEDHPGTGVE